MQIGWVTTEPDEFSSNLFKQIKISRKNTGRNCKTNVEIEVLTTVTMFWDVTPCSPVEFTDVSQEGTAPTVRVDEYAKQATVRSKQADMGARS
jgi:hypothetical protein